MRKIFLLLLIMLAQFSQADVMVVVKGISNEHLDNVRTYLSIYRFDYRQNTNKTPVTEYTVKRLHENAEAEIAKALMPYGWYSPTVDSQLEKQKERWIATYTVTPGPLTRYTDVLISFDGPVADLPAVKKILASTKVKTGAVLDHTKYNALKSDLLRSAVASGYLDAEFTQAEIRVSAQKRQATVKLQLKSGTQFQFGDISIKQSSVDQSLANRFITINKGQPFDSQRLIAVQLSLNDSGYFDTVQIDARRSSAIANQIPVVISASPRKKQRFTSSLGIGTDTGPRAQFGVELRRLGGRGHKFRSDLQISTIKSTASAQYQIPIKNIATDKMIFIGNIERAEIGDTDSDLYTLGARRFDKWRGLRRQIYTTIENEVFSIDDTGTERSELLVFGSSLSYQRSDNELFTRKGFSARVDVHGASNALLSQVSFLQTSLAARLIRPLGSKSRVLLRSELGVTGTSGFSELPPTQRFFTGGDRSVRGYAYEELSPTNDTGDSVGGKYLFNASIEADHYFTKTMGLALFVDTGNAFNNWSDNLKTGAGLGFRYRTPVGVLRVDLAHPFDDPDTSFRLHLSLGPDL